MGDDPPFLSVGTEVSAKYKGAFCEAKVRKVVKSIKCKVMFKLGLGSAVVSDDQIKGLLRVGAQVEAKHPERGQYVEAVINKIQDCSQYTVVFDDGDITTLRRTSLCLKSGRHFAESETLDQLPLTHPEHFGTPVLGGRRGGRKRDDSSDDDDEASESSQQEQSRSSKKPEEKEPNIGKVVCVEVSEKKKGKESWFPGLIVAPTAQDAVPIRVKDEYLVRSFKDGRYYTVPKKEATEFTREVAQRPEQTAIKAAIDKALLYLDRDELPPHWDREVLFGLDDASSINESKGGSDAESSDDETREEKDHFVAQLYKFMDDNGTPINKGPTINSRDLDLYRLFKIVNRMGGFNRVTNQNGWKAVTEKMVLNSASNSVSLVKQAYKKYLYGFEDFYRKLGCTMNSPRSVKSRSRPGRSLIRDKDRATSGASTPKREQEDDDEKPRPEENTTPLPPEPPKAVNNTEDQISPVNIEEEAGEGSEEPAAVLQQPARKQRERSVPARLLDSITPKSTVKKEEDSGGDDVNDQENESNSNQSMRSQRTRTRIPRERLEESDQQDSVRSARKRGKSRGEDKTNDDDDKITRSKPKEEEGNAKEETEKKLKKEDNDKKTKTPGREGKSKNRKNDENKGEDSKKGDDENGSVDAEEPTPKRRGRKPRAVPESDDDDCGKLPPNVDVQIGDKLKVYYCPMQDSKVTYEAKVCEIRTEGVKKLYLVHYTGWNTRYDEWIKRSRIAENLTWTPNRKRSKSVHSQEKGRNNMPSHGGKNTTAKRGRTRGQDSSRSATPSSVTSTSSTGQRNVNALGEDGAKRPPSKGNRRRSRRISEMSAASAGSLESSDDEDEDEVGAARVRKKTGKKVAESEESEPVDVDEADQTPRRRVHHRRKNSETETNSVDTKPVIDASTDGGAPSTPARRGRRRAITAPEATLPEVAAVKKEPENEEKIVNDSSNDLSLATDVSNEANAHNKDVRPETKLPLDVATALNVKASSPLPPLTSKTSDVSEPVDNGATTSEPVAAACAIASVIKDDPSGFAHSGTSASAASPLDSTATAGASANASDANLPDVSTATPLVIPSVVVSATSPAPQQSPESQKMGPRGGNDDDIYEFREPEPFAFEVRSRRESPFSEDRVSNRLTPRKSPKEEEDESIKKQVATVTAPTERNKSVITSPPRRSCVASTTGSDDTEVRPSEHQGVSVSPTSPQNNLEVPPREAALTGRTSPKRPLSPQPAHLMAVQEPTSKESAKTAVAVPVISAAAIQPPNITQVLPALSALAARSVPPSSRVSAIVCPPSVKSELKLDANVVNTAVKGEERNDCDEAEHDVAPQETVDETSKPSSSSKRRKVTGKKVVSQEFVESDEDSPNDQTAVADGSHTAVKDEAPDTPVPGTLEGESVLDTNVEEELLTPSKIKESSNSCRNKTDEDLDESSLLCEETIPGSPVTHCSAPSADIADTSVIPVPSTSRSTEMPFASAPSAPNLPRTRGLGGGPNSMARANRKRSLRETLAMQRPGIRPGNGSSLMMENTPPTTPDGSISSSSNSPQGDHYGGMSPDHESNVKSERELSESDNQISASQSSQNAGPASTARNVGPRATATAQPVTAPVIKRKDDESQRQQAQHQDDESPVKRRRRGATASEPSSGKKARGHGRSPRRTGSDSEDTAAEYVNSSNSGSTLVSMSGYIPRSTRYNFCTDLDPDLDASQRIASLQEKLRELRQTYSALKARVVMIDRRRKKLKRKEKDSSS